MSAISSACLNENQIITQQTDSLDNEALLILYKETGDQNLKWELVLRYTDFVKKIAVQTVGLYSSFAQLDDIVNEGVLVLLQAVDRFEIDKQVKFETYISKRLRGMIIDLARKQDWLPRKVRQKVSQINKAVDAISSDLGRMPTNEEVAKQMGLEKEEYEKMISDTAVTHMLSLEVLLDTYGSASGRILSNTDNGPDLPDTILEEKQLHNLLKDSIKSLKENEQMVLSLYYERELTMKEIAEVMNISAPRVSQIHSRAIQNLRYDMQKSN